MVARKGQITLNFNEENRKRLRDNFGTDDETKIKELLYDYALNRIENKKTNQDHTSTIKEENEKTKLGHNRLKLWNEIRKGGGTPDDYTRLVYHNEIPCFENQIDNDKSKEDEKPKLSFNTFGNTIKYTAKKIKQDDNSLRCLRCNRAIPKLEEDWKQVDDFVKHVNDAHGELTNEERSQLMQVYQR